MSVDPDFSSRSEPIGLRQHDTSYLRSVPLPARIRGRLWLSAMPGSRARLQVFLEEACRADVGLVVCLAEASETQAMAPEYAATLQSGTLPFPVLQFPVRDLGVPADATAFTALTHDIAGALREGERAVLHCRAGVGRTGMAAQAVLFALGMSPAGAQRHICNAGSRCETPAQAQFIERIFSQARN
ncbi:Tyrosine phosphatase family protein [Roseicitreum antarcticum]|uniref:Tyrosine phosphatase family protein n=2 Tax=Roseicitreum antarcticum TaxID=564137 RepID=A0A1H3D6L4_9RHOB|nr:Tyrosine phosphatase family protein [Roseicitreum antarcticum]